MKSSVGRALTPDPRYTPTSDACPGRELKGHADRSGTTIHGWPAVAFGAVATAPAVFIGLLLTGAVGDLATQAHAPTWVIGACGLAFGAAGMALVVHGLRGVVRRRAAATQRRAFPMQPWHWDHDWDVRGSTDRGWEESRRALTFAVMASLILAPGNWAMIALDNMPFWAKGVVVLFDFMVAYALWQAVYLALRTMKYGRPRLRNRDRRAGKVARATLRDPEPRARLRSKRAATALLGAARHRPGPGHRLRWQLRRAGLRERIGTPPHSSRSFIFTPLTNACWVCFRSSPQMTMSAMIP